MSTHPSARHGRIHLDQQRKRAKELLARLQDGSAPAQLAQLQRRSRACVPPRLADAQWLIARERGFPSWPKLKAHMDTLDFAVRHPSFAADDEAGTWHWRCGNDIVQSLERAGFRGRFAPALRHQLQELPGRHDGLSLTERLALQIVRIWEGRPWARCSPSCTACASRCRTWETRCSSR